MATVSELVNDENIIFEEKYVVTYYSTKFKIVGIVWNGLFSKEEYIDCFERLLVYAKDHRVIGIYSDIRKQGIVPIEARKHFEKHISHRATKLGVDKTGVVSDSHPVKKYYFNTILRMTGRQGKIFANPDKALNYVLT